MGATSTPETDLALLPHPFASLPFRCVRDAEVVDCEALLVPVRSTDQHRRGTAYHHRPRTAVQTWHMAAARIVVRACVQVARYAGFSLSLSSDSLHLPIVLLSMMISYLLSTDCQ